MNNSNLSFRYRLKRDMSELKREMHKHRMHYFFMMPYALIFTFFTVLPVIIAIYLSFTSFNMLETPEGVGLQNYFKLFFNDDVFLTAVKNTIVMAIATGPGGFILSFLFAWLINELAHGLRVVFTVLFYAPSISGGMFVIWTVLFSGDAQGLVNNALMRLGIINSPVLFFQDPAYMLLIVIMITLWMSLGTTFLVFIAGLQSVDTKFYEAGAIDGIRNRWQELWFITLPLLKPQLLLGAVLSITASFGVGDAVTALCGFPSTNYGAHMIINHLQDYGAIRYEMGYACAIATILFLLMLGCNMAVRKMLKGVGR